MDILVVEDDESTRLMLRLILSRAGHRVVCAADAEAGLAALRREDFDWLVVDGQLPPSDGFTLADKAKELRPAMGVVMISGVYEAADIAGRPIARLFQKPVDTDALISYLNA